MSTKKDRERRAKTAAEQRARALRETSAVGLKRILRWPEVVAVTGRGRTSIQDDINNGRFPKPVPLGGRAVGWLLTEIEAWIAARAAERHQHIEAAE
jgi:prophage regulatory protein